MNVMVTGGTGFVGRAVVLKLLSSGHQVRLAVRRAPAANSRPFGEYSVVGDIGAHTDWCESLIDIDAVVHLAARAHVMREESRNPRAEFVSVNYDGTRKLADACRDTSTRMVFLSSIGVHGAATEGEAFTDRSCSAPATPYAESKALAEAYLESLAVHGDLDVRVLRPPLVYGPGAPGNLKRLVAAVEKGIPLPLAAVQNRRSLIGVEHLAHAIVAILCADYPARTSYVIADREVVSTAEMVEAMSRGLGKSVRIWPLPVGLLRLVGSATGRQNAVEQLVGDLEIDASNFTSEFGDLQPCSTLDGLSAAAQRNLG